MGGAAPEPSKGGKKSLDAPINLVPYIDLMTTMITFLMMAAVWTKIAALEVEGASGGPPPDEKEEPKPDAPKTIIVLITDRAVKISEEGGAASELPSGPEGYDFKAVTDSLDGLKKARPDRKAVKMQIEDGVKYSDVVKIVDIARGLELTGITMSPVSGG